MRRDPPPHDGPVGLYLHFPFCAERCTYCDFPTVAGRDERIEPYLAALEVEIGSLPGELPGKADSVYLGGGTPSRMTPAELGRLLGAVRGRFELTPECEITLEGNPESLTPDRLARYRETGVTRVSVGVQSLDDEVLRGVGRAHDAAQATEAVHASRRAGFADVSLDLIAGLPGEDLDHWTRTVERAAALGPDHVSVYLLETDKDTPLSRAMRSGRIPRPDDDALACAYEQTVAVLEAGGLALYEISNFARAGHESRHNLKYWSDAAYVGLGLGAHSYWAGERWANRRDLEGYIAEVSGGRDAGEWSDPWDPERRLGEARI